MFVFCVRDSSRFHLGDLCVFMEMCEEAVSFGAEQWVLERELDKCDLWNPSLL